MGRNKYSEKEIKEIRALLAKKNQANRLGQKLIRHDLRTKYEFNISDFNEQGKAFGPDELDAALERKAIVILDDATIANMLAKRARDRERDAQLRAAEAPAEPQTDWKEAMKQWEEWENTEKKNSEAKD